MVIAGASSLLGAEVKSLLEEGRFSAADFRLLDEEMVAGTLTEAAGEATIIQPVEEGSFDRARWVFFTGSAAFTRANADAARRSGATVIDLSGALVNQAGTVSWMVSAGERALAAGGVYAVPSAFGTEAAGLALALSSLGLRRLIFTGFRPVSDAGRAGTEELESQTSQLLTFQNVGKPVFDTQVAFTMLDRFGAESAHQLSAVRERVRAEIRSLCGEHAGLTSVQILHAPVFYGAAFSACAELEPGVDRTAVTAACQTAGLAVTEDDGPSSISVAGENRIQLAAPEADNSRPGTWWFWGAADNIRLPAANAVRLADKLAS